MKYRQLLRLLHDDGWRHERTSGSHVMYIHSNKPGAIVISAGKEDQEVPRGFLTGAPSRAEMNQPMDQVKSYAFVIGRSGDGSYGACLPDLPGCATTADTPEQVERQLPEAVNLYLSYFHNRNLPTPSPQARVGTLTAA